jgi:putative hydrolase of the HAD superfamily
MRFTTIFFDLDDTLYPSSSGLWPAIKERMNSYMGERLHIPSDEIPRLREKYFREYGTTLRGLQTKHSLDVQDFLAYVHDLPLKDYLQPNPIQQKVLASLPTRNLVFTNADVPHARRVLRQLQIEEYFAGIVDVNRIDPYCKPSYEAFKVALNVAGEGDPSKCVMIDDMPRTTHAAKELGLYAILYGSMASNRFGAPARSSDMDAIFDDWNQLPALLNGSRP